MGKWFFSFLMLVLAGCTGTPVTQPAITRTPLPTLQPSLTSAQATAVPTTTSSPEQASTAPPATSTLVQPTSTPVTPTPPPQNASLSLALTTPASTAGWNTYTNASWHVALDYPADWSVRENASVVSFVSPRSATIQLGLVGTGKMSPEDFWNNYDLPNTRCSSRTNSHGVTTRVCFDTISFASDAQFIVKAPDGSERLLSLSTNRRTGDVAVFTAMLASLRLTP